jgi:hypothetical protein
MRSKSGTVRRIDARHRLKKLAQYAARGVRLANRAPPAAGLVEAGRPVGVQDRAIPAGAATAASKWASRSRRSPGGGRPGDDHRHVAPVVGPPRQPADHRSPSRRADRTIGKKRAGPPGRSSSSLAGDSGGAGLARSSGGPPDRSSPAGVISRARPPVPTTAGGPRRRRRSGARSARSLSCSSTSARRRDRGEAVEGHTAAAIRPSSARVGHVTCGTQGHDSVRSSGGHEHGVAEGSQALEVAAHLEVQDRVVRAGTSPAAPA